MVTYEEMQNKEFPVEMRMTFGKGSAQVSGAEMGIFDERLSMLRIAIADVVDDYAREHNIKPKYDGLEELTHISSSQIKQMINGRTNITRTSLYKLVVGLHMTVDQANELFGQFTGELTEKSRDDFICIKALEDRDDIVEFITQYNKYTKGNKLKDPLA